MATTAKVTINPGLVAALDHYAAGKYNPLQPTVYVHNYDRHQQSWPLERACGVAAEVLADEELNLLKLIRLQNGMREHGFERLYEKIMGEPLPPKS